jgi:hypothetical protein
MRKLMFLMLLLSGLSLVACGGDDDKGDGNSDDGADDNGDNGDGDNSDGTEETTDPIGDGEDDDDDGSVIIPDAGSGGDDGEDVVSTCDPALAAMIPDPFPGYEGDKPFSQADLMACQAMCGMDQACYTEANCPGLDLFDECANAEIIKCSGSSATGQCRVQIENFLCCVNVNMCGDTDQACVMNKCGAELTGIQGCIQADTACTMNQGILASCLGTDEVPPTDPGTGGGGGTTTIHSAHTVKQLMQSLKGLRQSH